MGLLPHLIGQSKSWSHLRCNRWALHLLVGGVIKSGLLRLFNMDGNKKLCLEAVYQVYLQPQESTPLPFPRPSAPFIALHYVSTSSCNVGKTSWCGWLLSHCCSSSNGFALKRWVYFSLKAQWWVKKAFDRVDKMCPLKVERMALPKLPSNCKVQLLLYWVSSRGSKKKILNLGLVFLPAGVTSSVVRFSWILGPSFKLLICLSETYFLSHWKWPVSVAK